MAKRKSSKSSTPPKKGVSKATPKKNSRKPPKKESVKPIEEEVPKPKRRAKRKQGFVPLKEGESMEVPSKVRKKSSYNIVSSAISKWCKENGKRCTKKEISEIYQGLKERYLTSDKKYQLTAEEIQLGIEGKLKDEKGVPRDLLAFKNQTAVPTNLATPFYWFFSPSYFNDDGLFFKQDDILRFDMNIIGRGVVEIYFKEFNEKYREDIYDWITEEIEDYEKANGESLSPVPEFVFDKDATDIENRIFEWKFTSDSLGIGSFGATQEGRKKVTGITDKSLPTEAEAKAQKEEDKAREKQESAPMSEEARARLDIDKFNAETRRMEVKNDRIKAKEKSRENDLKEVELGIMSIDEFKKKWKK